MGIPTKTSIDKTKLGKQRKINKSKSKFKKRSKTEIPNDDIIFSTLEHEACCRCQDNTSLY